VEVGTEESGWEHRDKCCRDEGECKSAENKPRAKGRNIRGSDVCFLMNEVKQNDLPDLSVRL